jgi:hypothetical protein
MRRIGFQLLGRAVQSRSVATKAPAATGKFTEAIKVAQLAQLGSKDVAALTAANNSEKHDSVALTEAVWRLKVMQGLSSVSTASLSMHASFVARRRVGHPCRLRCACTTRLESMLTPSTLPQGSKVSLLK